LNLPARAMFLARVVFFFFFGFIGSSQFWVAVWNKYKGLAFVVRWIHIESYKQGNLEKAPSKTESATKFT
jgi:hypothetical protein